jgi:hypothetical protein
VESRSKIIIIIWHDCEGGLFGGGEPMGGVGEKGKETGGTNMMVHMKIAQQNPSKTVFKRWGGLESGRGVILIGIHCRQECNCHNEPPLNNEFTLIKLLKLFPHR